MDKISKIQSSTEKVLAFSTAFIHVVAFTAIVYHSQIYHHIPVSAGDAYGLGDVINLGFAFVIVCIWFCSALSALILSIVNFKSNSWFAFKTLLFSSVALIGYFFYISI
ncbi:hypothetical protein GCM10009111_26930 [Colwellia asteriadis]|uniref:Uncharacterized protein n=1 Tax=Colwellia asteriadis TaxID=517723 RepID=A0ABP3WIK8_9GAMM